MSKEDLREEVERSYATFASSRLQCPREPQWNCCIHSLRAEQLIEIFINLKLMSNLIFESLDSKYSLAFHISKRWNLVYKPALSANVNLFYQLDRQAY